MALPESPTRRQVSWIWLAVPFAVAAWLRWRNIAALEPFVDEGANILTALDPRVRAAFEPLEQGRPLLAWLFGPAGLVPVAVLETGRLMTGAAGLVTMAALGWTLVQWSGRRAASWALWIWALLPIAVWHERLALQDPFVAAALALALASGTAGMGKGRTGQSAWAMAAGLFFGLAVLLKISAALAVPWLLLLAWYSPPEASTRGRVRRLAIAAAGTVAPLLALGRDLPRLGSRLGNYHALPQVGDGHAAAGAFERLGTWMGWYSGYGGWPLLALLAVAIVALSRTEGTRRLGWAALAGWTLSLVVGGVLYNNGYARYALPDHLPLVLGLGLALGSSEGARVGRLALGMGVAAFARWAWVDRAIGTDPASAPVPAADVQQYVTGPWSGRGSREVLAFLDQWADRARVQCVVLTHRALRPGCYALMLAERGDPRVAVVPRTVYEKEELEALRPGLRSTFAGQRAAFFLLYEGSLYPEHPWLGQAGSDTTLALRVDRGGGESFALYRFEP